MNFQNKAKVASIITISFFFGFQLLASQSIIISEIACMQND